MFSNYGVKVDVLGSPFLEEHGVDIRIISMIIYIVLSSRRPTYWGLPSKSESINNSLRQLYLSKPEFRPTFKNGVNIFWEKLA